MTRSTGSSLVVVCVVCESGQVNGGVLVVSWVVGLGLVLDSASVEFGDASVGEPGFSLCGAAS